MQTHTHDQLDNLRHLLDQRQDALQAHLKQEHEAQDEYVQVAGEAHDAADASFATLSMDLGNAAVERDSGELRAIATARRRLADGSYGDCTDCGVLIPYERLVAQPTATRCAPCQEAVERAQADTPGRNSI